MPDWLWVIALLAAYIVLMCGYCLVSACPREWQIPVTLSLDAEVPKATKRKSDEEMMKK